MAETKHTPGPWRKQCNYVMATVMGRETGIVSIDPTDIPDSQVEANAHLIAASPDLLAACERMAAWLKENGNTIQIGTNEAVDPWPELDRLRAVIAKAKGE